MQNQLISSRTVSHRTVLAGLPGFLGKPRDVEGLLNWTFGEQMAHAGGATEAAFTGYAAMGYSASCLSDHGGGDGLVPLRPRVDALAEAVFAALQDGLDQKAVDRLVVWASRKARPSMGTERVWFEPPGDGDTDPDGRPRAKIGYYGKLRWCHKRRRMVDGRRPAVCHVERRGPSPEAQAAQRAAYRAWRAALVRAYDSLKAAGFAVLPPAAPALRMEPWEGWTPRYARSRDLVLYTRAERA